MINQQKLTGNLLTFYAFLRTINGLQNHCQLIVHIQPLFSPLTMYRIYSQSNITFYVPYPMLPSSFLLVNIFFRPEFTLLPPWNAPCMDAILDFQTWKSWPNFFKFVYAQKGCADDDTAPLIPTCPFENVWYCITL